MKAYVRIGVLIALVTLMVVLLTSCGGGGGGDSVTASGAPAVGPIATLDLATLNAGGYYFQVHTANFPDGEVRGQITVPPGATGTITINTPLGGSEEVPPAATAGTGTGTLVVNLATGEASSATITVSGMSSTVSAAHIHQGEAGVNGPVVVQVNVTAPGAGIGIVY